MAGLGDLWNAFVSYVYEFLLPFKDPPMSAIFVILLSGAISIISTLSTFLMSDVKRIKRYQKEINRFNKMKQEAEKSGDRKLMAKVRRLEPAIAKKQSEIMGMRFKPLLVYIVPLILLFAIVSGFYTEPVAYIPFDLSVWVPIFGGLLGSKTDGLFGISFFAYYFIWSFFLTTLINKIVGLT
ncbi:MAG: EMC3/TMCO1 family protein [Candidatus Asgardarchaeia archaeon]